jgi:hypothetical protein
MTFEKKCFIEIGDVLAVHFECAKCHAATVVPIHGGITEQAQSLVSGSCRFCRTPWGFLPNTPEHQLLIEFTSSLEQLAAHLKGRNLKLRLEVECQP